MAGRAPGGGDRGPRMGWNGPVAAPAATASNMACSAGEEVWWTISKVAITADGTASLGLPTRE